MYPILYREHQAQDLNALSEMIRIAWRHDEYYSPKTAAKRAGTYLCLYLTAQSFTQIAVVNQKPVGIIMGNNLIKRHCSLFFRLQATRSALTPSLSKEGRKARAFSRR